MAATRDDMLPAALPPDDGSLDQAVADLDSKLAAWSGAILRAQSALKDRATVQEDSPPPPEPTVPASTTSSPPAQAGPAPTRAPVPEVPASPAPVPAPAAPSPAPVSEEPAAEAAARAAAEDEALLASLDPDTAKKVLVLRRLCNNRKSVRELVEKVRSTPSSPAAPPAKKSFWRR